MDIRYRGAIYFDLMSDQPGGEVNRQHDDPITSSNSDRLVSSWLRMPYVSRLPQL